MVWFVYCTVATYWTGVVIGRAYNAHPALKTYPDMAAEAFARLRLWHVGGAAGDAQAEARLTHSWRKRGRRLVVAMQFVTYYLDTVTQMIYVAQYFGQLVPGNKICQWMWLLVVWGISVPIMQIPTFHASRWIIVPAMAVLMLSVALFLGEVVVVGAWNCQPGPSYGRVTPRSIFVSLAAFAYAYGGHGMFPEALREMKSPKQWPAVMGWTYAAMVPIYIVCMIPGYYAYGDFAQANINLNFPDNWVNTASVALQLLQCYYLIFYTNVVVVMAVEIDVAGVDPTTTWAPPVRWAGGLSPVWVRLILRTAFLGSQVLLAELFLAGSGSGDLILDVQALTGAVGMAGMTFFLPSVLAWGLLPRGSMSWLENAWCHVNFWFGILIAVAGVYTSLLDLLDDAQGGNGDQCLLKYTYAPYDPGDPCYISGIGTKGGLEPASVVGAVGLWDTNTT